MYGDCYYMVFCFDTMTPLRSNKYPIASLSFLIIYIVYKKKMYNFIYQKPRSAYTKNSGKSVTTEPPIEQFLPEVDRRQLNRSATISFLILNSKFSHVWCRNMKTFICFTCSSYFDSCISYTDEYSENYLLKLEAIMMYKSVHILNFICVW